MTLLPSMILESFTLLSEEEAVRAIRRVKKLADEVLQLRQIAIMLPTTPALQLQPVVFNLW
jgi:hypothetical protein